MFFQNVSDKGHRSILTYHERIGHLFVPNIVARFHTLNGGYFVKTNSQGFRSDWDFLKECPKKPRILFFGDSNTAGDGVNNSERFSDIIGRELSCETYNFGLPGSGTDQQLLIKELLAKDIEADLIILCPLDANIKRNLLSWRPAIDRATGKLIKMPKPYFLLNENQLILENCPVPKDRPGIEPESMTKSSVKKNMLRHTIKRLVREKVPWMKSLLYNLLNYQPFFDYKNCESQGWKLMRAIMERFLDACGNTPVIIAPIPSPVIYLNDVSPMYLVRFREWHKNSSRSFELVDVLHYFRKDRKKDRKKFHLIGDPHLSPAGHRLIAECLKEIIGKYISFRQSKNYGKIGVSGQKRKDKGRVILGISCFFHDSAAAIIQDGRIVAAAQEERFSRVKHDKRFPLSAINYCLEEAKIYTIDDIDAIVYYESPEIALERVLWSQQQSRALSLKKWNTIMSSWVSQKLKIPELIREKLGYTGKILENFHHRSHAASAFFPSPFEEAAILTVDGVGEWSTATVGVGECNKLSLISEMRFPHSVGLLYSAFTFFCGFKVNSGEYKLMGLAPYGNPIYKNKILERLVKVYEDGSIEVNMDYFGYLDSMSMINEKFNDLFDGPPRRPEAPITQREMDVAASIQQVTEEIILKMARYAYNKTKKDYLCLAGGVALNCVANGRLLREGIFKDIWIQPAAGDAGGAIGAALDTYYSYFGRRRDIRANKEYNTYLGPAYSEDEISSFLNSFDYPAKRYSKESLPKIIAEYLEEGKVIGIFWGRMEFGPRALGARSILGDARSPETQSILNLKIKFRESFRPFAPAVLQNEIGLYFDIDRPSPYMLLVAQVRENRQFQSKLPKEAHYLDRLREVRSEIPAVTHIDYSARIQSVSQDSNRILYSILKEFKRKTGCGVVVNTSFNVRGEPIVCSPEEAYRCFMRTNMDVLVLGNFVLIKELQPKWKETRDWRNEFALD